MQQSKGVKDMKEERKQCYKCNNFERYYTRGVKKYTPTRCGWCCKKVENVDLHDSCEAFQEKRVKIGYKQMRRNSLSNLLTEISEIRKVIEAEENEKKKM